MRELIDMIRQAELDAEEQVKTAQLRAKEIMVSAEKEVEKLRYDSAYSIKQEMTKMLKKNEIEIENLYNQRLKQANDMVVENYGAMGKIVGKMSQIIIDSIMEQYGDC